MGVMGNFGGVREIWGVERYGLLGKYGGVGEVRVVREIHGDIRDVGKVRCVGIVRHVLGPLWVLGGGVP